VHKFYDKRNAAGIEGDSSMTVFAGNITLDGGTGAVAGAIIGGGADSGGGTMNIYATGNVNLLGGSAGSMVALNDSSKSYNLTSPSVIGSDKDVSFNLTVGGNLNIATGVNGGGGVVIGSLQGSNAKTIAVTGDIQAASLGSGVVIGAFGTSTFDSLLPTAVMNISSSGSLTGRNVGLFAPTINIYGGVTATGSGIGFVAGNLNAYGSNAFLKATSATGDVLGRVTGNINLSNSAYFRGGRDVELVLAGADSTLTLSSSSYLLADSPSTIKLNFSGRSDSGLAVDSTSGLYVNAVGKSAAAHGGLQLTLKTASLTTTAVTAAATAATAVSSDLIGATGNASTSGNPTTQKGSTQVVATPDANLTGLGGAGKVSGGTIVGTVGGGADSFGGSESDSSSSAKTADKTAASGGDEKASDKKDDKDDKKSDEAKDDKKDEKPAQKKVAQCS